MSDSELLAAGASGAGERFAVFYRRHVREVLLFCARRGLPAEDAADLTGEVFAAALHGRKRFVSHKGSASGWLLGIAAHKLADRARRWSREQSANRMLATIEL